MNNRIKTGVVINNDALQTDSNAIYGAKRLGGWMSEAYEEFFSILGQEGFPCLFGRSAFKRLSLRFLFVSWRNHMQDLLGGLLAYTAFVRETPLDDRLYSPIIVIFERTGFFSLHHEREFCWEQLRILHENDPAAWPVDVPVDIDDSRWTFCFDGEQLFFNMSCPSHLFLKSRNLGKRITFIVNPRKNFDAIASAKSKKGIRIREIIRKRVSEYNGGYVPSELGFFGDGKSLEWKQYQLREPGEKEPARCPFVTGEVSPSFRKAGNA